ncbi:hypothetical protein H6G80_04030 [Nostoc sp. FACHB-87]|uniref:hypothetical protein n=1 Tax=Nostocaceae TaxID=1162 RepID=UPI001684245C|nr:MULTISPECIES: hypothetical protein [Nostocaceae]MBD2298931.1 hypothetical protein [Nostoc sp. FACHB-190]MBD2453243.1 hypothetical protein [Nostoc sp. FACHB-87]MBD2474977.1 hypothetical protein [Anabaena sp. FACHB-83]
MLEAIKSAIASATTLEEIEALQGELQELADAISELQEECEERYEEIEAEISAEEEAEFESEELERTGEKLKDCGTTTEHGDAIITKFAKTWEITLLHPFYGQAQHFSLPANTPENEVLEKAKFYLAGWPFEIQPYCGWYRNQKVEVSAEEILEKGIEAAKQEKLDLLFKN